MNFLQIALSYAKLFYYNSIVKLNCKFYKAHEMFVNEKQKNRCYLEQKKVKYLTECFNILNIYFWIHGIGLPKVYKSVSKTYIVSITSFILAVFYEGNMIYYLLIRHRINHDLELYFKTLFIFINYVIIGMVQRYYIFSSRKKFCSIFNRVVHLYSIISKKQSKNFLKYKLVSIMIFADVLSMVGVILVYYTVLWPSSVGTEKKRDEIKDILFLHTKWSFVAFLSMYLKNTCFCIALYFGFICTIVKEILFCLEKKVCRFHFKTESLVELFNETLDITKKTNGVFSNVIFVAFVFSLGAVFYQMLDLLFNRHGVAYIYAYRFIATMWYFLPFLIVCLSSSSITEAAENFKYSIEKERKAELKSLRASCTINQHFFGFTVLDSIIIDKSLILSAGGILLSYGMLIATFNFHTK